MLSIDQKTKQKVHKEKCKALSKMTEVTPGKTVMSTNVNTFKSLQKQAKTQGGVKTTEQSNDCLLKMTENDIGRLKIKGWSRDMSGKCKQKENKTVFRVIEIKQDNLILKMCTQLFHEYLLTVKSSNNTELHRSKGKHC